MQSWERNIKFKHPVSKHPHFNEWNVWSPVSTPLAIIFWNRFLHPLVSFQHHSDSRTLRSEAQWCGHFPCPGPTASRQWPDEEDTSKQWVSVWGRYSPCQCRPILWPHIQGHCHELSGWRHSDKTESCMGKWDILHVVRWLGHVTCSNDYVFRHITQTIILEHFIFGHFRK